MQCVEPRLKHFFKNRGRQKNRFTQTSRSAGECCSAMILRDSTALSLTMVSSTVARDSRGGRRQCTCSLPPTRGVKVPSCSARASSTWSNSHLNVNYVSPAWKEPRHNEFQAGKNFFSRVFSPDIERWSSACSYIFEIFENLLSSCFF